MPRHSAFIKVSFLTYFLFPQTSNTTVICLIFSFSSKEARKNTEKYVIFTTENK